jgi:signal transduction histidine kinase
VSFAGFVLFDVQAGVPVASIAWFIPADTVQVLTAAIGLRYCFDRAPDLKNVNSLAKYGFFAVLLAPFLAAFVSARGIPGDYWASWRISFLSDVLAFITLTPAILSWFTEGRAWVQKPHAYHLEFATLATATVLLGYFTFAADSKGTSPALLYSLVPFLLWSALRFGWIGITSSMLIIAFSSVWGLVHGRGPFSSQRPQISMLALQLFLIFAATPFMVLTAVVEDRKLAQEKLARLSGRLIEAQEDERKRIARDIHDDYAQRVAILAVEIEALSENVGGSSQRTKEKLRELFEHSSELGADLHALSHQLYSSTLDRLGLVTGVKAFCKQFAEQEHIEVDFADKNIPRDIPGDVALCLFRIVQEGLRNVKRHSGANNANVRLECSGGNLHLTISDQGKGFDSGVPPVGGGIGIWSMQERLRLLGGKLRVQSHPMEGTRIDAWIPSKVDLPSDPD